MWFPLDDISVLRRWVRTRGVVFPYHTYDFGMIMAAMTLLLALILAVVHSPQAFGMMGIFVYSWNVFGFDYIRKIVAPDDFEWVSPPAGDGGGVFGQTAGDARHGDFHFGFGEIGRAHV